MESPEKNKAHRQHTAQGNDLEKDQSMVEFHLIGEKCGKEAIYELSLVSLIYGNTFLFFLIFNVTPSFKSQLKSCILLINLDRPLKTIQTHGNLVFLYMQRFHYLNNTHP